MNPTTSSTKNEAKVSREKDHRALNSPYRVAILAALESLHDFQTRSSIDSIRKYVQSTLEESNVEFNHTLFLTTLKAVIQEGELEHNQDLCTLSESRKVQRTKSLIERRQSLKSLLNDVDPECWEKDCQKIPPVKKTVHSKPKITPKKVMDKAKIQHPMETI